LTLAQQTQRFNCHWDGSAWKQIDTEAGPNPDDFPSQNFNVNTYNGTGATQAIDAMLSLMRLRILMGLLVVHKFLYLMLMFFHLQIMI